MDFYKFSDGKPQLGDNQPYHEELFVKISGRGAIITHLLKAILGFIPFPIFPTYSDSPFSSIYQNQFWGPSPLKYSAATGKHTSL